MVSLDGKESLITNIKLVLPPRAVERHQLKGGDRNNQICVFCFIVKTGKNARKKTEHLNLATSYQISSIDNELEIRGGG